MRAVYEGVDRLPPGWVRHRSGLIVPGRPYIHSGLAQANDHAKLDYLIETSERSGRFDWAAVGFTTAWGIAVAAAFDPDRARGILETVAALVRHLLGGS